MRPLRPTGFLKFGSQFGRQLFRDFLYVASAEIFSSRSILKRRKVNASIYSDFFIYVTSF
jgi:hypothetical protein